MAVAPVSFAKNLSVIPQLLGPQNCLRATLRRLEIKKTTFGGVMPPGPPRKLQPPVHRCFRNFLPQTKNPRYKIEPWPHLFSQDTQVVVVQRGQLASEGVAARLWLREVVGAVEVLNAGLEGELLLLEVPGLGVQVVPVGPVVVQVVSHSGEGRGGEGRGGEGRGGEGREGGKITVVCV